MGLGYQGLGDKVQGYRLPKFGFRFTPFPYPQTFHSKPHEDQSTLSPIP